MSIFDAPIVQNLLNLPIVSRLRRNHGLEHASLNVLSRKFPHHKLAGHSDLRGFWLFGDVSIEDVRDAIEEALARIRHGEVDLTIHATCGTNFVTAGILAGLAAWVSLIGSGQRSRDRFERLPLAMMLATLGVLIGYPLGLQLQTGVTTCGEMKNLQVVEILAGRKGGSMAYRVTTRG